MGEKVFKGEAKLSPPWFGYYKKLVQLFKGDDEIEIEFNEFSTIPEVKVFVHNSVKADALSRLLPTTKQYGNVTLKVTVIPSNVGEVSRVTLMKRAFENNPNFSFAVPTDGPASYIVFKGNIAQYFDDNLSDVYGNVTMLYQDLAKEIFGEEDGIHFCTESLPN